MFRYKARVLSEHVYFWLVLSRDNWRNSFMKMRIDSGVQTASVKKDFDRQSAKLQENGVIHAYNDMVWFIHEEDRQDI
jgi:hypothetical protein